jgi:hypothetical protein
MDDCDSEYQASIYKNTILRDGFFGKTIIGVRPMIDATIPEFNNDGELNRDYSDAESEADELKDQIEDFIGAENAGGAMLLELDFAGDKFEEAIFIKKIESDIDADLFDNTEKSVRANILVAFNNLPVGLVMATDGLFSSSAGAILEMKKTYWTNTSRERAVVNSVLTKIYKNVINKDSEPLKAISLIDEPVVDVNAEQKKAQATLKGSVGGVTALLAIQQSVTNQTTDRDAAIKIIEVIYGIDAVTAGAMLGTPKINKDA